MGQNVWNMHNFKTVGLKGVPRKNDKVYSFNLQMNKKTTTFTNDITTDKESQASTFTNKGPCGWNG